MKRFFILLALFALFIGQKGFCADDMMDIDYQFIDNAFSKPNPTTNKQFEEVMKQYENKEPRGFFYNIRKFFNKIILLLITILRKNMKTQTTSHQDLKMYLRASLPLQ